MHDLLAEIFIQKGIIKYNTAVTANYIAEQFGGLLKLETQTEFTVIRAIKLEDGTLVFDLKQVQDRRHGSQSHCIGLQSKTRRKRKNHRKKAREKAQTHKRGFGKCRVS
jgi:hypothetical protein